MFVLSLTGCGAKMARQFFVIEVQMPVHVIERLRQSLQLRWYKFVPTDRLIDQIGNGRGGSKSQPMLDALRERLAYQDGSLNSVDWSAAKLNGVALSSCLLSNAKLAGANLRGAYFGYSDLRKACLKDADLSEASLRQTRLEGADLSGANLQSANLARADLRGARLVRANLSTANLWQTDLRGADLSQAVLTACATHSVKVDQRTILPDGNACRDVGDFAPFTASSAVNSN